MARVRASTAQRGYDAEHQRRRAALAPVVAAGLAVCWRCQRPLHPDEPWDLGHDDHDRSIVRGPEHRHSTPFCVGNRAAGTRKLNAMRRARSTKRIVTSQVW